MKTYWIVWHSAEYKAEAVLFDNYNDAYQTAHGYFGNMSPSIGERFYELYEDNAPLLIEKIELPGPGE